MCFVYSKLMKTWIWSMHKILVYVIVVIGFYSCYPSTFSLRHFMIALYALNFKRTCRVLTTFQLHASLFHLTPFTDYLYIFEIQLRVQFPPFCPFVFLSAYTLMPFCNFAAHNVFRKVVHNHFDCVTSNEVPENLCLSFTFHLPSIFKMSFFQLPSYIVLRDCL